jgi:hypothetical protein
MNNRMENERSSSEFKTLMMPSEKKHKDLEKMIDKIPNSMLKPPFSMIITGGAGSGKSSLLYTLLKKTYRRFFDVIYIFNRCRDSDDVWRSLEGEKKPIIEIFNEYDDEKLGEIIKEIEDVQEEQRELDKRPVNVLFVFDDCLYSGIVKKGNSKNVFNELIINRRHLNASVIFTSQNYMGLEPGMRTNNLSGLCVMGCNTREMALISAEHNGGIVDDKILMKMYDDIKEKDPYGFLVINYQRPREERFCYNFVDVIRHKKESPV